MGDLNDTNYQLYLNNCSIRILFTCIENTDLELTLAIKYVSVNFRTVKVYHQCSSRLVAVLLGTLYSSIKQIEGPYVFDWENAIALHAIRESGLISWRGGSLMGFLELRQAHGVYSRVKTGMPILNGSLFSEVRTLV